MFQTILLIVLGSTLIHAPIVYAILVISSRNERMIRSSLSERRQNLAKLRVLGEADSLRSRLEHATG